MFFNQDEEAWGTSLVSVSSVPHSCPTLCDPMDHSTPGLPVHHRLPEFTQTHVHCIGDAIQPSHPLSSPSPPAFNLSQHQVFSNELVLHIGWPKYWSFSFNISPSNEYSGLISFRIDWFQWLKICLAMQGKSFRPLVWELRSHRGATKPVSYNYWAHVPWRLWAITKDPTGCNEDSACCRLDPN